MLETLKLLLNKTDDSNDLLLQHYIEEATVNVMDFTNQTKEYCESELKTVILNMAVISFNRNGSEGLASQSYSGVSENFIDGIPIFDKSKLYKHRLFKRKAKE